mmetsp:Transcript_41476/g.133834  ORF Transcript_41476/g.133834 Transcript_41476/m.133834 type:complete len:217 (+) Transcript_41476:796-1446(+)
MREDEGGARHVHATDQRQAVEQGDARSHHRGGQPAARLPRQLRADDGQGGHRRGEEAATLRRGRRTPDACEPLAALRRVPDRQDRRLPPLPHATDGGGARLEPSVGFHVEEGHRPAVELVLPVLGEHRATAPQVRRAKGGPLLPGRGQGADVKAAGARCRAAACAASDLGRRVLRLAAEPVGRVHRVAEGPRCGRGVARSAQADKRASRRSDSRCP